MFLFIFKYTDAFIDIAVILGYETKFLDNVL